MDQVLVIIWGILNGSWTLKLVKYLAIPMDPEPPFRGNLSILHRIIEHEKVIMSTNSNGSWFLNDDNSAEILLKLGSHLLTNYLKSTSIIDFLVVCLEQYFIHSLIMAMTGMSRYSWTTDLWLWISILKTGIFWFMFSVLWSRNWVSRFIIKHWWFCDDYLDQEWCFKGNNQQRLKVTYLRLWSKSARFKIQDWWILTKNGTFKIQELRDF